MHRVSLIPGDGIGPEVTAAARAVLEASGAPLEFEISVIGQEAEKQSGAQMPPEVWESFARTKVLPKGQGCKGKPNAVIARSAAVARRGDLVAHGFRS